jgi:iron complex outermembrane recepter protein
MTQRALLLSTALATMVSFAGYGSTASAADAPTVIEEIVVTAQKFAQRLQDVPASVSAIGGETLQRGGSDELSSIVKFVPGIHWENINVSKPQIFIRGFGTTAFDAGTDPSIAVFVDEVYIPRFTGMSTELLDVERVEVLKGPQGTLYGRNAAGGAINLITRSPVATSEGQFRVGVSSRDTISGAGTVSGALSEHISGRFSFSATNGDGYINAPGNPDDGFNANRAFVRGKLLFDLGADTKLLLNADYGRVRESMWAMSNSGQRIVQKHPSVAISYTPDRFSEPYDRPAHRRGDIRHGLPPFKTGRIHRL